MDHWERNGVYKDPGVDSVACFFRRFGIEDEGSVTPGAHDFGRLFPLLRWTKSVLMTHKILFVYRTLDVFAWVLGATEVARDRGISRSADIRDLVEITFNNTYFKVS